MKFYIGGRKIFSKIKKQEEWKKLKTKKKLYKGVQVGAKMGFLGL
jgi:hypothetical protein